ncbi:class I adenylate-forming enzyme family protein [Acrocarpospora pleiomorpha]|nr:class I adenylate-forming enzyme family protein [Acrocarpospora pleiomorpha]
MLAEAFAWRAASDREADFIADAGAGFATYGQVDDRAEQAARQLASVGVGPGSIVALHLVNDSRWPAVLLGVWRRGASAVILSGLLRPTEVGALTRAAEAELVVTIRGYGDLSELEGGPPILEVDDDGRLRSPDGEIVPVANDEMPTVSAETVACIFATSGTTGTPKLVRHTHRDLADSARQMVAVYSRKRGFRETVAPDAVPPGVILYPFGHIAGLHAFVLRLWVGRRIVLLRKFDVVRLAALVSEHRVDVLQLVPAMLHALATTSEQVDLSSVKYITAGTAPLPLTTRRTFEERYGVPILATYGSTEVGPVAHVRYTDVVLGRQPANSVGRLGVGVEVRIDTSKAPDTTDEAADQESGATGGDSPETGEIVVRKGGAEQPWIGTGDIGYLEDGFLFVTGRLSDMLIVGGFNVFPADVERAIERTGLVEAVVVVPVPDDRLGQIPVAGVVNLAREDRERLPDLLRAEIAPYKIPRHFVDLPRIPLTAREKVDRAAATAEILERLDRLVPTR